MEWCDFDLDQARWIIPASKMKMKREHVVPLSRQALAILAEVCKINPDRRYTFSCRRDVPTSSMALNRRLRDLGFDTEKEHCVHGFRSTFSTTLNAECNGDGGKRWDSDVLELQLAHVDESSVRGIYNRSGSMSLYGPRAKLMQHWADRIDIMVAGNNVIAMVA